MAPPPQRPTAAARETIEPGASPQGGEAGASHALGMWLAPEFERPSSDPAEAAPPADATRRDTIAWGPPVVSGNGGGDPLAAADFGSYVLIEEIGRGGMGVVYKARQKGLDRIVAVKMILSSHLASTEQVERFYAEARAAARLQDPRIVAIHDVGQFHGQHFFAMEYMAGPSLAQLVRGGPLDPDQAARLVVEVARAVAGLHRQGVVHRDLKPSNILLDEAGQPRVTDFGLAKMLGPGGPSTRTGAIVGTPSYMSPEQAAGRGPDVSPLSDVYSLGAILYELLTGVPPFEAATPLDTIVQVLEGEPTPPLRLRPDLPRALEAICLRCLEKGPAARYPSADALADDLERHLRGEPTQARQPPLTQRVLRWSRREPALVARLATLSLCALITQIDQAASHRLDPFLNQSLRIVLGLGIGASILFQALLKRERWSSIARYSWATADMILFTSLIVFSDTLARPLVAGYFLLIAASGLWFRERLVWYTAALAALSYGALALLRAGTREALPLNETMLFVVGLALTAFVVAYQVKRVRALSSFYENRPLP